MRAAIWTKYGPPEVLKIQDINRPVPKKDEVLIRIHASTVTAGDCEMRRFDIARWIWLPLRLYMGILKPRVRVLGQELSGEVVATGRQVSRLKPGDAIFAPTQMALGAHAEYICLPERHAISLKPANLSFEEAATVPTGGLNALHFIRKAAISPGQAVLINGAGGCIGTYAVQLAKLEGAEVTVVDTADKHGMLKSIGADHVIDYTQTDFSRTGPYEVVIDIVGKRSFTNCVKALKPGGLCLMTNPRFSGMIRGGWVTLTGKKRVVPALADYKQQDLDYLKSLLEKGMIKPVIDRNFELQEIVEAHRYVETGLKMGNVVINMSKK